MGAVAAGAAVAGAGLQAYGAISSAQDQAALDRQKADIANQQSAEITARESNNEITRDQSAYRQKLAFGAAYAGSGKAGTGIGSQLEIQRQTDLANMTSNRDSQFQVNMLQQQAGVDTTLANETSTAGYLNAAGSILGGAGKVASVSSSGNNNPGLGGTQSLPPPSFG